MNKRFNVKVKKFIAFLMMFCMLSGLLADMGTVFVAAASAGDDVVIDKLSLLIGSNQYTEGMTVEEGAEFSLIMEWHVKNNVSRGEQITINLPDCIDFGEGVTNATLYMGGVDAGTYSIIGGVLYVNPTIDLDSNLKGYNQIKGTLSDTYRPTQDVEETRLEIYDKTYTINVVKDNSSNNVSVNKSYSGDYDPDKGQMYQIRVYSNGTNEGIVINDILDNPDVMKLNGDVTVSSTVNGTISTGTLNKTADGFTYELPNDYEMVNGEAITLTYYVKLTDEAWQENYGSSLKNTAKVTTSTDSTGKTSDTWFYVNKSWINKSASMNSDGTVTWTITVNGGIPLDIGGGKFTDSLPEEFTVTSDITITNTSTGTVVGTISKDSAGQEFSYTFPEGTSDTYTITYTTSVDKTKIPSYNPVTGSSTRNNVATLEHDNNTYTAEQNVYYQGIGNILTKTADSYRQEGDKGVVHWKSVIVVPENSVCALEDFRYQDNASYSAWNNVRQVLLGDSIVVTHDGNVIPESSYTFNYKDIPTGSQETDSKFEIDFGNLFAGAQAGSEIVIEYDTTFNLVDGEVDVYNYSKILVGDDITQDSSANYRYVPVVKKGLFGLENDNTTFNWYVTLDLDNPSVTDTLYITDILPENQVYVDGTLKAWESMWYDGAPSAAGLSVVSTDAANGTITFQVNINEVRRSSSDNSIVYLHYSTQIDDMSKYLTGGSKTYTNQVDVLDEDKNVIGGSVATTSAITPPENTVLQKNLDRYNEYTAPYVFYAIDVNTQGVTLLDGTMKLTLTDTLGPALAYVPGTLVIYSDSERTVPMSKSLYSVSYNQDTNVITIQLPDGTPCYISYQAKVRLEAGDSFSTNPSSPNYAGNKVSLSGTLSDTVSSSYTLQGNVLQSAGMISSELGSINLYKYDKENYDLPVEGAVYTAIIKYCLDANGNVIEATDEELARRGLTSYDKTATYKTDANGKLVFTKLYYDYLYEIKEVNAPDAYQVNKEPVYFYIKGDDGADYANSTVLKNLGINAKEVVTGDYINVYDEKVPDLSTLAKINISKRVDGLDTELSGASLQLTYMNNGVETELVSWTSSDTPRTFRISDISLDVEEILLTPNVVYTLKEINAPNGYHVAQPISFTVTNDGVITLNSANGTIETVAGTNTLVMHDERYITIDKIANNTNAALAGAGLSVYPVGNPSNAITWTSGSVAKEIAISTTDENGKITTDTVYVLEETAAPTGYKLLSDLVYFKVDETTGKVIITDNSGNPTTNDNATVSANGLKLTLTNQVLVNLQVIKTDMAGNTLSGAEFELYLNNTNGTPVATKTTDANGVATFTDLVYGNYIIRETSAPTGYEIITSETPVTINATTAATGVVKKEIVNNKLIEIGSLVVEKQDSDTAEELSGAVFTLENAPGTDTFFAQATTNEDGQAKFDAVPVGTYILTEVSAPIGYNSVPTQISGSGVSAINGNTCEVTITANTTLNVTVEDEQLKGSLTITKVDSANNSKMLSDAEFQLFAADDLNTPISINGENTFKTEPNGKVTIDDIPYGSYVLKETEAPIYYQIDNTTGRNITINSSSANVTMTNTQLSFNIKKTAIDSDNQLTGAELYIKPADVATEAKYSAIPLEDGVIKVVKWTTESSPKEILLGEYLVSNNNQLLPGNYVLVEKTAPNGYAVAEELPFTVTYNEAAHTFTVTSSTDGAVTANGNSYTLTMKDEHTGAIEIVKCDASKVNGINEPLENAEFTVTRIDCTPQETITLVPSSGSYGPSTDDPGVYCYKTGTDGKIVIEGLVYGTYVFTEIKSPDGYVITTEETTVILNSASTSKTIYNTNEEAYKGTIRLIKYDLNDTSKKLEGAEFELYQGSTWIAGGVSDKNGVIVFENIPYGDYIIHETSTPKDYKISGSADIAVTINADNVSTSVEYPTETDALGNTTGGYVDVEVGNEQKTRNFTIQKKDSADSTVLSGAWYALYEDAACTQLAYPTGGTGYVITGADGKATFSNVIHGTYYLKEVKAPDYYDIDTQVVKVVLDDTTEGLYTVAAPYEVTDSKIFVNFSKKALGADTELSGAYLTLQHTTNSNITKIWQTGTMKTFQLGSEADAASDIKNVIAPGTYTLTETSAPNGYLLADVMTFTIADDGTITGVTNVASGNLSADKHTLTMFDEPCGKVTLTKVDSVNKANKLADAEFKIYAATDVSAYDKAEDVPGNVTPIMTKVTGSNGTLVFDELPYGTYAIFESAAPDGYIRTSEKFTVTINEQNTSVALEISNTREVKTGRIVLTKTDTDNNTLPLENAIFRLTDSTGKEVATAATNATGKITFENIPYGTYTLTEITAPDGYSISLEDVGNGTGDYDVITLSTIKVTLGDLNDDVAINVSDSKLKAPLKILKVDSATRTPIAGVTFNLYEEDGTTLVQSNLVTDANGIIEVDDLVYGNYVLVEMDCPESYILPVNAEDRKTAIEISENNLNDEQVVQYTVTNEARLAKLQITKRSFGDNTPLYGAVYALYNNSDMNCPPENRIAMGMTDDTGMYTFTDLPYGTYYLKEMTPPVNYAIDENAYEVTIPEATMVEISSYEVKDKLAQGSLIINKLDYSTGLPIQGAEFTLYDKDGNVVDTAKTTNADGMISYDTLDYGVYILRETNVPDYYEPGASEYSITIQKEAPTVETIYNYNTTIEISKQAASDLTDLEGAVLKVTDTDGNLVKRWMSGGQPEQFGLGTESGKLLPDKEYILTEEEAPAGYLRAMSVHFKVDENGIITILESTMPEDADILTRLGETEAVANDSTLIMYDDLDKTHSAVVQISKKAVDENTELTGATLKITDKFGNDILSWVSGEEPLKLTVGVDKELAFDKQYILMEETAPKGYAIAEGISFYINYDGEFVLTGENGELSADKKVLTMRDALLVNPDTTDKETLAGEDDDDDEESDDTVVGGNGVDTGDKTPLVLMIILLLASLGCIIFFIIKKKDTDEEEEEEK